MYRAKQNIWAWVSERQTPKNRANVAAVTEYTSIFLWWRAQFWATFPHPLYFFHPVSGVKKCHFRSTVCKWGQIAFLSKDKQPKSLGLPSKHWPGPTLLNFTQQAPNSPPTGPQGRGSACSRTVPLLLKQATHQRKWDYLRCISMSCMMKPTIG